MQTYSLDGHGWMLGNTVRTRSYIEAIRRIVRPGDTVLDIGTGVGTWAIAACQAGARRVYALDHSDVIVVGRELAAANGCGDTIEFMQTLSTELTLDEPVDVIVQEVQGVLPLFGPSLATIIDARTRLLKPGGTLIPHRETLWAALVSSPEVYATHDRPWGDGAPDLILEPVRTALVNHWLKRPVNQSSLVGLPQMWAHLDYDIVDSPHVRGRMAWSITEAATLHGVSLWFDAELADGVAFSNAPGVPGLPFGQAFFPWSRPVDVAVGDTVHVELAARLQLDRDYLWYWAVTVSDQTGRLNAYLQQSDFWRDAIPPMLLTRAAASYVPGPNTERAIDATILDGFARHERFEQIVATLTTRFADRFGDREAAANRIAYLADAYNVSIGRSACRELVS